MSYLLRISTMGLLVAACTEVPALQDEGGDADAAWTDPVKPTLEANRLLGGREDFGHVLALGVVNDAYLLVGDDATEEAYEAFREQIGVNDPFIVQYGRWLGNAATGDLGESWNGPNQVSKLLKERLSVTFSLAFGGLFVAATIGTVFGIAAGVRAGRATDTVITAAASSGQALPNFWVGILLVAFVALPYAVFPATAYTGPTESVKDWLISITLPSIALGTAAAAAIARQTRAAFVRVLHEPYIRTALSVGLSRRSILYRTALRNASIPVVTSAATLFGTLLGGAVVVEAVFAYPGLGSLVLEAIQNGDLPIVLGFVFVAAVGVALVQLTLDITYTIIDPRTRVA